MHLGKGNYIKSQSSNHKYVNMVKHVEGEKRQIDRILNIKRIIEPNKCAIGKRIQSLLTGICVKQQKK